jgi:hypothetical protein
MGYFAIGNYTQKVIDDSFQRWFWRCDIWSAKDLSVNQLRINGWDEFMISKLKFLMTFCDQCHMISIWMAHL